MKGSFLTIAALLVAVGLSFAQQGRGRGFSSPEENAKRQTERLEKELKLSAEQKDSVYTYTLEQGKTMQALSQSNDGDRRALMGKMRGLREETDKKIRSVLDESQKAAYDKMVEERANRMRQGGNRRGGRGNS